VGLVTVASALGGDPDPAYARRAISFLNGCGLALLHLDLAPCVAMRPSELGACVEVLDHLIRGGSLAELAGRLHLRSAVESLGGADLSQHLRAAVEAAESAQTHPTPLVQRPQAMAFAQSLLDGLEVFADRAGFLACGDLGVALDVLVAMEEGLAITALTPERRRHHLESSPRARLLVRHALSPRRIASLAQEAQPS
jgi:hypothetical protein